MEKAFKQTCIVYSYNDCSYTKHSNVFVWQTRQRSSRQKKSRSSSRWSRWWTWGTPWCRFWKKKGSRRWARSKRPSPSWRPSDTRRQELRFTGHKAFTHTHSLSTRTCLNCTGRETCCFHTWNLKRNFCKSQRWYGIIVEGYPPQLVPQWLGWRVQAYKPEAGWV